ncbi:MAG: tyrosine-type recombinase/integrase [Anaerolineae bacterium]|nr:tyrosine-type recombinase/integrase [Anaerolineae bacterium]
MTRTTGKRAPHFKNTRPTDPTLTPFAHWPPENRIFYTDFRAWLKAGSYSEATVAIYSLPVRLALSLLNKPYHQIDPVADLEQVRTYLKTRCYPSTCTNYHKGLVKLAQYLRRHGHWPTSARSINWDYYLDSLPPWLVDEVKAYLAHCQRTWPPEQRQHATRDILSRLTISLRWFAAHTRLAEISEITPALWFDFVDARLMAGIQPVTLNANLHALQEFLRFLADQGYSVSCPMLQVEPLPGRERLPRDMPVDQLRLLLGELESEAATGRLGLMDRAWCFLMLYSGLRTGEIRTLRLGNLDLTAQRVRIEQGKGRKDRVVCLNQATVATLEAYLPVRGAADSDYLFLYRLQSLSPGYCGERLRTYGQRCGLHITPHQLRHCFATLLLNAGAPIVTVQALLGHKRLDTTLGYTRLYDSTLAADYYRVMAEVERRLTVKTNAETGSLCPQHLLSLIDLLQISPLTDAQQATVQALRMAIAAWVG